MQVFCHNRRSAYFWVMEIYLFNPDSDMALAANKPNYTPPANIRRMVSDMSMLPVWYAASESVVLSDSDYDRQHLAYLKTRLDIPVELMSGSELRKAEAPDIRPWGWNMSLRNHLIRLGIDSSRLPSDEELTLCRRMSSRSVLADSGLLRTLQSIEHCDASQFSVDSVDECRRIISTVPRGVVFKKPWSSSGKGLLWCRDGQFNERDANWCRKAIDEQGVLVASPIYNKVLDFAMEFHADRQSGSACFAGYSLFRADSAGRYKGNMLAPDDTILCELTRYVPLETLLQVRDSITAFVPSLGHSGYMGVDMLVYETDDGNYGVCPAVEHNLRMTMGMVCRSFADRFLDNNSVGTFEVRHFDDAEQAADFCRSQSTASPLRTRDDGRILSGFLNLTAVGPECQNMAFVTATH